MAVELPELYFRIKENGAAVFRVDPENRQKRIELEQIANVNVRNGEIKVQGKAEVSEPERRAMQDWLVARQAVLAERDIDDIHRTIDHLNLTAHWAQAKATPEQLEAVTDRLLLAMYDLRQVLVRKKADRMNGR
jgi:hypothetical protein